MPMCRPGVVVGLGNNYWIGRVDYVGTNFWHLMGCHIEVTTESAPLVNKYVIVYTVTQIS